VNNNEEIAKMFEIVIWLIVSNDWSIQKLQRKIMQRLKLNVEDTIDLNEVALLISIDLKCKKYLLLLDEVWEAFKLTEIGIYGNQKDSKVVLATRDHRICQEMDTL
jgi:disease resistance protein RPS2